MSRSTDASLPSSPEVHWVESGVVQLETTKRTETYGLPNAHIDGQKEAK